MAERRPNSHQRSWPEPVWTRNICIWPAYGTSFPWIFPWILADFARLTTIGSHQRRAFGGSEPVLSIAVATDSRFCDLESFTVAFLHASQCVVGEEDCLSLMLEMVARISLWHGPGFEDAGQIAWPGILKWRAAMFCCFSHSRCSQLSYPCLRCLDVLTIPSWGYDKDHIPANSLADIVSPICTTKSPS